MKRNVFRKTHHFLMRQWERCIHDFELDKVLNSIQMIFDRTTHVFISYQIQKKLGLKFKKNETMVLVVGACNKLITLFFIDDFYSYIKSKRGINHYLLNIKN
jgi:hypothetical protein